MLLTENTHRFATPNWKYRFKFVLLSKDFQTTEVRMNKISTSNLRLGIVAGGQLGKMLIQEASKWGIETYILDNDPSCPAAMLASRYVQGHHLDYHAVLSLGRQVDILTYELENINIEAVRQLKAEGISVKPDPEILAMIQDKGEQKLFYQKHNIPTAPFQLFENAEAIREAINHDRLSLPFVQKLRRGGYDGRGVFPVSKHEDLFNLMEGPSITETRIDIDKEVAVLVARNFTGEIKCFPVVEMVFDPRANLVDKLFSPASVGKETENHLFKIATTIVQQLQYEGILAIEFFISKKGEIFVNEMAPRTHNSGHHTIESMITSQFEQHIRAILNLPLGSTEMKKPAVMINVLGAIGYEGPVKYEGLEDVLAIDGVKVHLYGKKITKPFRKMGHVTILGNTLEEAMEKAEKVKTTLKVKSL